MKNLTSPWHPDCDPAAYQLRTCYSALQTVRIPLFYLHAPCPSHSVGTISLTNIPINDKDNQLTREAPREPQHHFRRTKLPRFPHNEINRRPAPF